jgi:hypothetical protein
MELDFDNLMSGSDDRDGLREKPLHIRLDRTTVNGHIWKVEHSVVISDVGSIHSVRLTSENHASAIANPGASIGSRQGHGANNRPARTGNRDGRTGTERT